MKKIVKKNTVKKLENQTNNQNVTNIVKEKAYVTMGNYIDNLVEDFKELEKNKLEYGTLPQHCLKRIYATAGCIIDKVNILLRTKNV